MTRNLKHFIHSFHVFLPLVLMMRASIILDAWRAEMLRFLLEAVTTEG
jgi:hypothetical protein